MKLYKLALSVSVLGVLMGSCAPEDSKEIEPSKLNEDVEIVKEEAPKRNMSVAYVNSDTIMSKYEFATSLRDDLTAQQMKYEGILRQKENKLRSDMQKLQAEAASLSQFEGQNRERKLYAEQEKLQTMSEEYTRNLMLLEQDYNREIDRAINNFLDAYCADKTYEMVLSNSDLGLIRWADKRLDITDDVLNGLNEAYLEEQAATTPELQ